MKRIFGNIGIFFLLLLVLSACAPRKTLHHVKPTRNDPTVAYQTTPPFKNRVRGLIVIDPGHGGEDQGTKSTVKPVYAEKNLNLKTAKFLAQYLEHMGFQTILTRNDDVFIPLKDRALFANARKPILFVSVHYNAAPSKEAKGIEVFYYKSEENKSRTKSSKDIATSILNQVLEVTDASSRGVKHGNYAVIRETDMPAVLVEGGFMSNSEDFEKLKDPTYLKRIAQGIAQGINRYFLGS